MSHIHTNHGQHDLTASAYILMLDNDDKPQIYLHRHKKLGIFMQFGGHVELNETPWQAIIHELREESGYDISQLQIMQPSKSLDHISETKAHPYPITLNTHYYDSRKNHFHTDIGYLFVTKQTPKYQITDGESKTVKLFYESELPTIYPSKDSNKFLDIVKFCFDVYNDSNSGWVLADTGKFEV